jgi:hypothetical protein
VKSFLPEVVQTWYKIFQESTVLHLCLRVSLKLRFRTQMDEPREEIWLHLHPRPLSSNQEESIFF